MQISYTGTMPYVKMLCGALNSIIHKVDVKYLSDLKNIEKEIISVGNAFQQEREDCQRIASAARFLIHRYEGFSYTGPNKELAMWIPCINLAITEANQGIVRVKFVQYLETQVSNEASKMTETSDICLAREIAEMATALLT